MNAPLASHEAAARADAVRAQVSTGHALALVRLIVADMEREAHADRIDNGDVEAWGGMLRWLVSTLDERNDDLRDRYLAAGWLQQRPAAD